MDKVFGKNTRSKSWIYQRCEQFMVKQNKQNKKTFLMCENDET